MTTIILLAPLVGALICGFFWTLLGERLAQIISTGLLFLAAILSWYVFLTFDGVTQHISLLRWIESGSLSTDWGIRLDRLTAIMLVVVTTVSALVHLYSFGYWRMTRTGGMTSRIGRGSLPICRFSPLRCWLW